MNKHLKTSYAIHHQIESFFTGCQVEFDSSGKYYYCAYGSTINKISVEDGQVVAQIPTKNEDDNILRFTLSPDDELLIIAYASGLVVKFNLSQEVVDREFRSTHNAPISLLKINPSGSLLATASSDSTVKLWNLKSHYCSHNLKGINGLITSLTFKDIDDYELLFCSAGDDNIHVFDLSTGNRISKLSSHCGSVTDMKFSSKGDNMISVGRDQIAVVWNVEKPNGSGFGQVIRTIPLFENIESIVIIKHDIIKSIIGLDVEPERTYFATIGEEGLIKFWDSKTGAKIFTQCEEPLSKDRCPGCPSMQLIPRPAHDQVCAISMERDFFIYELPKLNLIQQLQGHIDEILSACWFANDDFIAMACNSHDLKVICTTTSKCQHLKGHQDIVLCVKPVATDPLCLISSSKDCSIIIWKFDTNDMSAQILYKGTGHTHAIHGLGVLNGGNTLFSAGEDTTLKRWTFDLKLNECDTPKSMIASQTIKAHEERIDDIAISPNDQLVATASRDKTAKIFSAANMTILATLRGHKRGVNALQFSPVDQILVTAADLSLRMWNLNDFSCVKTFQGHDCSVLNFKILSSGLQIISIGSDGNMKLWDIKTNECVKTIDAHNGNAWALAINYDDSKIVTGGQDQKLVIWKDQTKEEQEARLANIQSQVLQEQDFMNYVTKKRWFKALAMAIKMESQPKTLNVIRELLLDTNGLELLEQIVKRSSLVELDFFVECCITWTSTAKNCSIGQQVLNAIIRNSNRDNLLHMPSLSSSLDQLQKLTEKGFNRYERLVQQAYFVDFFLSSFRIQ